MHAKVTLEAPFLLEQVLMPSSTESFRGVVDVLRLHIPVLHVFLSRS